MADLLRDSFKRGKYQDVILPLTVRRRIDSVLAPNKDAVLETNRKYAGKLDNPDQLLRRESGYAFYNTSRCDFDRLVADPPNLAANLRNYIAGFSPNMREVVEKFDFDNTIGKLVEAGLLYLFRSVSAMSTWAPSRSTTTPWAPCSRNWGGGPRVATLARARPETTSHRPRRFQPPLRAPLS